MLLKNIIIKYAIIENFGQITTKDVITIFSFHFGHDGHFEIMQIRITYVFGYVLSSMEKII